MANGRGMANGRHRTRVAGFRSQSGTLRSLVSEQERPKRYQTFVVKKKKQKKNVKFPHVKVLSQNGKQKDSALALLQEKRLFYAQESLTHD